VKFRSVVRALVILLGIACGRPLYADYPIEVIELQSRSLDEIIPVIRPLLGADESVTGMGNHLVLKAPPDHVRQIRRLLSELDRPPQRLLITVDNQGNMARSLTGYRGSADIRAGDGQISINSPGKPVDTSRVRIRLHDSTRQQSGTSAYQVQALEGQPAWINSGMRMPVFGVERYYRNGIPYERHTAELQDVTAGFYVVPRLQGDAVMLEILQHDNRAGRGRVGVSTQGTGTVVRGRLGEWLQLGGIDTRDDNRESGPGHNVSSRSSEIRQIRVKVDCLDCGGEEPGIRGRGQP
jgi:hypothetical protein